MLLNSGPNPNTTRIQIDLGHNQLTSTNGLGGSLVQLQTLNLAHNRLAGVEGLVGLSALKELNLAGNRIARTQSLRCLSLNIRLRVLTVDGAWSAVSGCGLMNHNLSRLTLLSFHQPHQHTYRQPSDRRRALPRRRAPPPPGARMPRRQRLLSPSLCLCGLVLQQHPQAPRQCAPTTLRPGHAHRTHPQGASSPSSRAKASSSSSTTTTTISSHGRIPRPALGIGPSFSQLRVALEAGAKPIAARLAGLRRAGGRELGGDLINQPGGASQIRRRLG